MNITQKKERRKEEYERKGKDEHFTVCPNNKEYLHCRAIFNVIKGIFSSFIW